ncbi:MAG: PD-(D/E)XK nuclease family protein, partial [Clostridiales bacterium]|nr:PD-(D/E)XK nuclease family protein [Clostridiales bacterium]MDY5703206.1 PD-(D/E)XK nuclease family protein [Eubacteriales bacterium]
NNLNKLVRSELWQRVTASERAERELEFTLRNEDGSLVQGIIDCCFIEDGAWVIVDYKTNYVGDNDPREIAERYIPQLTGYENALKSITGIPVGEKWIYLLSAGLAVKIGNG